MRYLLTSLILALSLPAWGASQTRTSSFAYDASTGLLIQEVIEPDTTAYRIQTDYTYDAYGNKLSVTVSGVDITTRTTTTVYDANGQFPIKTTNALNQSDTGTYDARFGTPTSLTGPNGLTTTWSYDGFGRKVNETRADGTQTNVAYNVCDATCPYNAKYYIATTSSGSPASYVYYDMLNRAMRSQAQGFDGRLVTKDTQYDSLGRVSQTSLPYYVGDAVYWASFTYDQLNRPIKETQPDGSTNQTSYNGLTIVSTNALNQTQTKVKNSQGQLISVTDTQNNVLTYQYDPFGNLTKTTDAKGNVITLTYDLRGRKIAMSDPDMGYWTYQYNVLGELVKQTDAKSQAVTMSYDIIGRMLNRTEPDLISNWTYDTQAMGIGKLTQVTSDNGYKRSYTYDSLGRATGETSTIDTTYTITTAYDTLGRVAQVTYPTGFSISNIYNTYGYLAEVRNTATNASYWKANTKDALGHVLNETLGNGLTTTRTFTATTGRVSAIQTGAGTAPVQNQSFNFDALGNLIARFDQVNNFTETFAYDTLNRLSTASQGGAITTVAYDSLGNITSKSDVGSYTYAARPHAVTQVAGVVNATYTYDANGNLTSGNGRYIGYNSYNLPAWIMSQGSGKNVNFLYNADHARIKQISTSGTTIYLNPRIDAGVHFEKEIRPDGVVEYKHYIYGGGGVAAVYTTRSNAVNDTRYFHQDHLGSIAVVTSETGAVVTRYAFDPWGKRIVLAGDGTVTHHGFTGHEHLDDVGLIHMNGRVYDPVLGRFLSADPYIQAPDNLQSYNRYSYVLNNPLSYTDPSGFSWWTKFRDKVVKPVVAAVAAYYTFGYTAIMSGSYVVGGASAGFVSGAINGGTLKDAAHGALNGAFMGYLGGASAFKNPIDSFSNFVNNAQNITPGDVFNFTKNTARNEFISLAEAKIADRAGMRADDFNSLMMGASIFGNNIEIVGTRFHGLDNPDASFKETNGVGFRGYGNRGTLGLVFDTVDAVLGYQGLPTASTRDYLMSSAAGMSVTGHSLGTLDASYIVGSGVAKSGILYALPFGNIAPANMTVNIGNLDPVTGGGLGKLLNWNAHICNVGFAHSLGSYQSATCN